MTNRLSEILRDDYGSRSYRRPHVTPLVPDSCRTARWDGERVTCGCGERFERAFDLELHQSRC